MARPFLTARWSHLVNLTYAVDPALLEPHTPRGVTLDVQDGRAFVSLVAFDFLETRVWGIPWPGFTNFPELNLRFYVKDGDERGVVFIREYVPQRLVASMANALYNEPYVAAPMGSLVRDDDELVTFELWLDVGGRRHHVRATGRHPAFTPPPDSRAHYFKEHEWGWGTDRRGRTLKYRVEHPVWQTWPMQSHALDLDFATLYGPEWAHLADAEPVERLIAVGSPVKVFPGEVVP
jgi:hypothetical protein